MLFAMIVGLARKRTYLLSLCLSIVVIGGCLLQVSCGGSSSSVGAANTAEGTPGGSYTIVVTGAAGATQHTASITLIVQ